jgi:hypothetical protein
MKSMAKNAYNQTILPDNVTRLPILLGSRDVLDVML